MNTPPDQKAELFHAILYRRGLRTLRAAAGAQEAPVSLRERSQAIFDTVTQ
jgi:hypothetical protein